MPRSIGSVPHFIGSSSDAPAAGNNDMPPGIGAGSYDNADDQNAGHPKQPNPAASTIVNTPPATERRTYHPDNPTQARQQETHEFGSPLNPKGSDEDREAFRAAQAASKPGDAGTTVANLQGGVAKTTNPANDTAIEQNEEKQTDRPSLPSPVVDPSRMAPGRRVNIAP